MELDSMLKRLEEVEAALGELRSEIEKAAASADTDPDDEPSELLLRHAKFLNAFVDAGGELARDDSHEAARQAGYTDIRGIAGWFNGRRATLRANQSTGMHELTGPGWEYWQEIKHLVEE